MELLRPLEGFYEQESGGLMLHALHLTPDTLECDNLSREYRRLGFTLQRHCYTLKKNGTVKALIAVNLSNVGLNLSDLTNCIQVIVLDPEQFPKDIVYLMLSILTQKYDQEEIPVLVYPLSYADSAGMPYDKKYSLWALNIQDNAPHFLKYLAELINRSRTKRQ
jgi:hypothetical protein